MFAVVWVSASGCVNIFERQHVVAEGPAGKNYFRITVSGYTFLATSQYAAGWYDAGAVDTLFGELQGAKVRPDRVDLAGHTPRSGGTGGSSGQSSQPPAPANPGNATGGGGGSPKPSEKEEAPRSIESINGEPLNDKRYVMFLSTNADSFASQLGALAQSSRIVSDLTGLFTRDERRDQSRARAGHDAELHRAGLLVDRLRADADALAGLASPTGDDLAKRTVELVRAIAVSSNAPGDAGSITDLASARKWLEAHAAAFVPAEEVK